VIVHEELASVSQRMIWLSGRVRGSHGQWNYPLLLRLRGSLDSDRLGAALNHLVARHEALRTTFARRDGLLTQLVHDPQPVPVVEEAVTGEADLWPRVRAETARPIDPARSPIRVTRWRVTGTEHVVCLNAHHLVTDAWSSRILTGELVQLLAGSPSLPRVPWQYRHFVAWQRRPSTADRIRADADHWRGRLEGAPALRLRQPAAVDDRPDDDRPVDDRPVDDRPVDDRPGDDGGTTIRFTIDSATAERIQELARREQTTPFTVLLAVYYLALHGESGELDLSVVAPFANRLRPETAATVGLFANLLVLRTRLAAGSTLVDAVRRTRETVNDANGHQTMPYHHLPAGDDRFDRAVFQLLPELPAPVRLDGLEVEVIPPELASRFGLELALIPHRQGYRALLQYASDRISHATANGLASRYLNIAAQASRE
jgi:hypothetical protein